jgi:phosphocarrier protein HPr
MVVSETVVIREITVVNRLGLHARAAARLVNLSGGFRSEITVVKNGVRANAKSIMGILMLAAGQGSRLTIEAAGDDAAEAADALVRLIVIDRFHEE